MAYLNWINPADYTMECFLLFDRWALRVIFSDCSKYAWFPDKQRNYKLELAKALYRYPYVYNYARYKAPECWKFIDGLQSIPGDSWIPDEMRASELFIIKALEIYVVCFFPHIMNTLDFIRDWDEQHLHDLADLTDKLVLDVGAGTGRLTFPAAKNAKRVYASDPSDCMREYLTDRIRRERISNIRVVSGTAENIPYEDDTFDAVISGNVIGSSLNTQLAEITRVTKNGGWLVLCNGDDSYKRPSPAEQFISRGFEWFRHDTKTGGIIYDYRKQVVK